MSTPQFSIFAQGTVSHTFLQFPVRPSGAAGARQAVARLRQPEVPARRRRAASSWKSSRLAPAALSWLPAQASLSPARWSTERGRRASALMAARGTHARSTFYLGVTNEQVTVGGWCLVRGASPERW